MSAKLHRLDIRGLAAALRDGVTVRQVTEAMLARAERLGPALNLFTEIWPEAARTRADALDRAGPGPSPLWGVPMAHKDLFARPARQPSCGVSASTGTKDLPPAPVLARLEEAGTVELGAANLAEFALGTTGTNEFMGDVGNPWNPAYCTGASSSGSGALVAAGVAHASLGTDSGASCRLPASFCGAVGLKPTHGAIPTDGVFPLAWSLDTVGLLTRTAQDCALVFEAMGGPMQGATTRPVIGVPRSYYGDHAVPEVVQAWERAARVMEAAGYRVIDVDVVETQEIRTLTRLIMRSEAASVHRLALRARPENYPLAVRRFISGGEGVFATDYVDAQRLRGVLRSAAVTRNFSHADVLLTPTCPVLPPRYAAIADAADAQAWRTVALLAQYTQPASYFGFPALSVPFGISTNGLPIGMQLIGRPNKEAQIFASALALQAEWEKLDLWPGFAA